jgi:hypothetical protein
VSAGTGTSARTYTVDCPRLGWDDLPDDRTCLIAPLDHYGQPTGELFCYSHFAVVGTVTGP